jgi:anti-sigma factor RsiW
MNDSLTPQQLSAFVDGELGLARQLEIEQALEDDASLRSRVEGLQALREQIRKHGDYHAAPAALRQRLETTTATQRAPARPRRNPIDSIGSAVQSLFGWRPLAATMAATLVLTLGLQFAMDRGNRDARLTEEIVGSHVRSTLGQHLVDVASSDHHTVRPFLSSKLDFSPPVRDTDLGGAVFVGGRVDYLAGKPVAALVYRQGEHMVNTFVWPSQGSDRGIEYSMERGFQIAHWSRNGMTYWAISDVSKAEFAQLVERLAS